MQPKGNPATKMNWRTTCADRAVCCAEHAAAWYSVPTPERICTVQQHGHRDQHAGHRRHRGHHLRRQGGGGAAGDRASTAMEVEFQTDQGRFPY